MSAPTIHISDISLSYRSQLIFDQLNLSLPAGQWTALLGPSGIGKSSLLRMIAGLPMHEATSTGTLEASNGYPVSQQIAYMAQTDLLLPWLTVLDNVMLGTRLRHTSNEDRAKLLQEARSLISRAGLTHAEHLFPSQLSGGMRQRAALVRTLMENKPLVLMDEPFSALDAITRYKLQSLAVDLLQDKTVLFITHDPLEALRLAHQLYALRGQPAQLKQVATLSSMTPRALHDAEVTQWQEVLFNELTETSNDENHR